MEIKLKLVTTPKQIESMMLEAMSQEINKRLSTITEIVKAKFVYFISNKIKESDEYQSLLNGKLQAEFGLDDADIRVNTIIREWANKFTFKLTPVKPKTKTISGGFSISAIRADFGDVINMAEATLFSKGGEVPWLRWLLLDGYKNLIADYDIRYGNYPKSRTGAAQMYRRPGKVYKIPNEFAGSIDDNWITRVFGDVDDELYKILLNAVDKVL